MLKRLRPETYQDIDNSVQCPSLHVTPLHSESTKLAYRYDFEIVDIETATRSC